MAGGNSLASPSLFRVVVVVIILEVLPESVRVILGHNFFSGNTMRRGKQAFMTANKSGICYADSLFGGGGASVVR